MAWTKLVLQRHLVVSWRITGRSDLECLLITYLISSLGSQTELPIYNFGKGGKVDTVVLLLCFLGLCHGTACLLYTGLIPWEINFSKVVLD